MITLSGKWRVFRNNFPRLHPWQDVSPQEGYAILQLLEFEAKCAHFLNFILGRGVFAYDGNFRKIFLTFPFGYRVPYKKIGLFCVLFAAQRGLEPKKVAEGVGLTPRLFGLRSGLQTLTSRQRWSCTDLRRI